LATSVEDMIADHCRLHVFNDPTVLGWCGCHSCFRPGEWQNYDARCGNPLVFECLWYMTSRIWSNSLGWEDIQVRLLINSFDQCYLTFSVKNSENILKLAWLLLKKGYYPIIIRLNCRNWLLAPTKSEQ